MLQILVTGFAISMVLWAITALLAVKGALKLHREKVLAEKWLLVVPFLFTSLVFFGLRYRFLLWVMDRQALHELFSIGSYGEADRIVLFLCLPLFYAISVLKPEWVVRTWVNLPLLIFLPFALRLALYLSGIAPWEQHAAQVMPTRIE